MASGQRLQHWRVPVSTPRLLTTAEVERWAAAIRTGKPIGGATPAAISWFEAIVATALNGATDKRTAESVDAIEGEARNIARHLIDQARR